MLVRGSVEDGIGAVLLQNTPHPVTILDGAQHRHDGGRNAVAGPSAHFLREFVMDRVHRELARIEQQQHPGP